MPRPIASPAPSARANNAFASLLTSERGTPAHDPTARCDPYVERGSTRRLSRGAFAFLRAGPIKKQRNDYGDADTANCEEYVRPVRQSPRRSTRVHRARGAIHRPTAAKVTSMVIGEHRSKAESEAGKYATRSDATYGPRGEVRS